MPGNGAHLTCGSARCNLADLEWVVSLLQAVDRGWRRSVRLRA